jgi:uncharacterized protein (TIRG00374 family)
VKGRAAIRLAIGFGLSILLLFLVLRATNPQQLATAMANADFRYVAPAILLYFCGVWVRSVRWGLLLPRGAVPNNQLFQALVIGFTFNNLLPARLGEVARAYLLARWRGVSYGNTFASVVVERVLDGLALAFLLLVGLVFVGSAPGYLLFVGLVVGGAFSAGALVLVAAAIRPGVLPALMGFFARFLPAKIGAALVRVASTFGEGLGLIRGWRLLGQLVALSLLGWAFELSMFYAIMFAFHLPADPILATLVGTVANFATLVPSSPGYVGTFDSALVTVLRDTAGISAEVATAYALLIHATLFLPVTLLGIAFLWRAGLSLGEVAGSSRQYQPVPVTEGHVANAPSSTVRG